MPDSSYCAVIVAGDIVCPANHSFNRAIAINRDQGALRAARDICGYCCGCCALHFEVKRCPDIYRLFGFINKAVQLRQNPIREVAHAILRRFCGELYIGWFNACRFCCGNHACILHDSDNHFGAFDCCLRIGRWSVTRGCLDEASNDGGFGQADIFSAMVEEFPARRINAVSAAAEIDFVQIQFEDLVLGKFCFHGQRQNDFPDLTPELFVAVQIYVACKLLGDG